MRGEVEGVSSVSFLFPFSFYLLSFLKFHYSLCYFLCYNFTVRGTRKPHHDGTLKGIADYVCILP